MRRAILLLIACATTVGILGCVFRGESANRVEWGWKERQPNKEDRTQR